MSRGLNVKVGPPLLKIKMENKMARTVQFTGDPIGKQVQTAYQKILDKLAIEWDTDIVMCLCHGKYEMVPSEMSFDKLYMFIQLLPKEFEGVKKHQIKSFMLDGKELIIPIKDDGPQKCPQGDTLSFTKSPERAEIITDDKKEPMAAIYDGGIYMMNDFIHCRGKEELDSSLQVFNYVITKAIKTDLLKHLKAGVEEKSKRALEGALKIQFTQRLDKELLQMKAAKDTITQYEKGITEAVRKVIAAERIVEAVRRNMTDVPTALVKTWRELDKMKNSDSYTSISFTRTGIKAITTPIVIEHQKKKYDMGRYEVCLSFTGESKINSLDKKDGGSGYDHPHVSSGNVCWGNFAGYIPKLIGSSEFDVALIQIHTFLCHYDSASPYRGIEHWPEVKIKEDKKKTEETLKVRA